MIDAASEALVDEWVANAPPLTPTQHDVIAAAFRTPTHEEGRPGGRPVAHTTADVRSQESTSHGAAQPKGKPR